jgi:hypothetical protein
MAFQSIQRPTAHIRLSADDSAKSSAMKRDLEANGYSVETVLSDSRRPVATCGKMFLVGYAAIRGALVCDYPNVLSEHD